MNDLFKGIYSKFTGSTGTTSLYVALTGGLHNAKAPEDTTSPYATMHIISDIPFWTFDATFEDNLIQFSIYDKSSSVENIGNLFEKFKTLYDDTTLTFDDHTCYQMKREFSDLTRPSDVWQYVIQYRVGMQLN